MNGKTLAKISLVGLSCLAVTASFIALSNHSKFNLIRSTAQQDPVVMTKDNFYQIGCYNSGSWFTNQYAFFQLRNPGNYVMLNNYSSTGGTFGDGHIFSNTVVSGYTCDITLQVDPWGSGWYFDEGHTRPANCPGFAKLTKVVVTLGEGHTLPFDSSKFSRYDVAKKEDNVITLEHSNITKLVSAITLFRVEISESAAHVGEKVVIDQIVLTYTCPYSE